MVQMEASDLFLTTGAHPSVKVHGVMHALDQPVLLPDQVKALAYQVMREDQIAGFERYPELNLAISQPKVGRFRVNVFRQRNQVAMVVRHIKTAIPKATELGLPPALIDLVTQPRGLILIVGSTGSGKSTTMASLIGHRNDNIPGHIVTIEDPIEFIHDHRKSIVNQREVGIDTQSVGDALQNTLRQAPDVIVIGEIRDSETMEHAITFAQTGHLVMASLHADNSVVAFERIVNFFPENRRDWLLMDLAYNIRGVVSQRLLQATGGNRILVAELLLATPLIADIIHKGEFHRLREIMEKSTEAGMQTFDDAIYAAYKTGKIAYDEALHSSDAPNNLRLRINIEKASDTASPKFSIDEGVDRNLSNHHKNGN